MRDKLLAGIELTPAQVTAAARQLLVPANRTVGLFLPTAATQVSGYTGKPPPAPGETFPSTVAQLEQQLREARLERVAELHRSLLGADSGLLVIVGDFDPDAVIAQVTRLLADWRAARPYQRIPRPPQAVTPDEVVLPLPDKQLAAAVLALPLRATDETPEYPALRLLEHLLGGGSTARLYHRVRELEGLSYDVEASFYVPPHHEEDGAGAGCIVATATCAPKNARKALLALLDELATVAQRGVTAKELQLTKQGYARAREAERADDGQLAERLLELLVEGRTLRFDEAVDRRLAELGAAALQELARKVLVTTRAIRALAGDFPPGSAGAASGSR